MDDLVAIVAARQREEELALLGGHLREGGDSERGPRSTFGAGGEAEQAEVGREAARDAAAIAARHPVDLVAADVAPAARFLIRACQRARAQDLGPVRASLLATARAALDLDRELDRLAAKLARAAREDGNGTRST